MITTSLTSKRSIAAAAVFLLCAAPSITAQGRGGGGRGGGGRGTGTGTQVTEDGIPVTDPLIISKCASCHAKDDKSNLTRISWIRTTPEGWEEAIKRMVRLNGLTLQPSDAKLIVKSLSATHGLAPEEAKPVMYMTEHRIQDEVIPNESIKSTCNNCHALGRVYQWHRTRADWSLLADMHSALYPQAEAAFRRNGQGRGGGAAGAAASAAAPGGGRGGAAPSAGGEIPGAAASATPAAPISLDTTLDFLAKSYGLHTPEWANWKARMRTPRITGRWLVSARVLGKGKYYGEVTIAAGAAPDEFTTTAKLKPVNGGPEISRTGAGLVYTGYSWRGRSKGIAVAPNAPPDDLSRQMREALWIAPDQNTAEGRWFFGEYDEFGIDVKMKRVTSEPMLLTVDRYSIKTGTVDQRVRIFGSSLPAKVTAADLELGAGVTVKSIVSNSPGEVVATVDVDAAAIPGKRDLVLGSTVLEGALAIYDRVDYIKVTPETALARLGGDEKSVHPRGYQQLEAIGYSRGEDGKLHTADDVELGPVEVSWSVEEFYSVFGDDDKEFVGTLNGSGLFTPSLDGPNPQRKFGRNNYGDVWVVATTKNEKDKEGKPLTGKSYLVVTVPTYIRWDQPEVSK